MSSFSALVAASDLIAETATEIAQLDFASHNVSANGNWPQRKTRRRAFDHVSRGDVAKLVNAVVRQVFQEVEFADVDALFNQQVMLNGSTKIKRPVMSCDTIGLPSLNS